MKEKVEYSNGVSNAYENQSYRTYDSEIEVDKSAVTTAKDDFADEEKKNVKEQKIRSVGLSKLFCYATRCDTALIIIALLACLFMGTCWPLVILVFGGSTDSLANYQYYPTVLTAILAKYNVTPPAGSTVNALVAQIQIYNKSFVIESKYDVMAIMTVLCQYYAAIALGMFLFSYLSVTCLNISSQNQIAAIRKHLYRSIMRQNIGWFDEQSSGALNHSLVDDINSINLAIGDKFGQMILWFSCGVASLILAFVKGWKLTLVSLSVAPLLGLVMFFLQMTMLKLNKSESKAYSKAGGIAEEVLGAIRTVVSFGGEKFEVDRYTKNLDSACKAGIKKGLLSGLLNGLFNGLMFGSYSLGFWYGAQLVRSGELTTGSMLIIFFCCMIGAMGFGMALPHLNVINKACAAAAKVFEVIERIPEIDKMNTDGIKLEKMEGNITFDRVGFHYPTRKECPVLQSLSLQIQSGKSVALVGASGCGKSSIIQLIQRFYDAIDGQIRIDGINIKDFNVMWLREQIGVVSQEPILFACSIKENIRYGRLDVTDEEIHKALEMANALTFVEQLPNKLDTILGERGAQISGGQKQRIAIARALVRNPKILLLDEATSALDTESERNVQRALDNARIGRTTVIVAHRLSTIRNADVIFGIKDGAVKEAGNHEELMKTDGLYRDLVERQKIKKRSGDGEIDEVEENVHETINEDIVVDAEFQKLDSVVEDVKKEKKKKDNQSYFMRIMKLNQAEMGFIVLGCIGAMFNGASQPAFSILFGYIVPAMANPDLVKQQSDIQMYVIAMACIAFVVCLSNLLQFYGFAKSGERLTKHCRSLTFKAMLRQDMAWFDNSNNNVGALTTRLSDESSAIRGLSGENLGTFCQGIFSMGAAVIIAFAYTWQISLVILAFIPFLLIGGFLEIRLMKGDTTSDKGALEESGKIAVETIENIRTVSSLTREETFISAYNKTIAKQTGDIAKKSHIRGFLFGMTQSTIFCAYAATFILAGYLLQQNLSAMTNIFISFGALIFGAMYLGKSVAMAPDYGKGKVAAKNMFELFERKPVIDSYNSDGVSLISAETKGLIEIENVSFKYPLRPKITVLRGITMDIQPNTTVALVGQSGCGKSTIIQLVQRMYDVNEGRLDIEKNNIKAVKINELRNMFGHVSQEPILFAYSIRENIAYADDGSTYTTKQIEEAAKASNIHDFISKLPDKYETMVGEKGSNLSGGQKQRIAIARALLRNPTVLLLDEATSALDTESEKIVQEALDRAQQGRTCIVIAHRLSTIQNAHKILVFDDGKIAEIGTHQELLDKNGLYSNMIKLQTKD